MPKPLPSSLSSTVEDLIPFADVRLIVADLDGTLIKPGRQKMWDIIPKLVARAGRRGVYFTLATGRTLTGLRKILPILKLRRRAPVILYNGAVVAEPRSERLIQRDTISSDIMRAILERMEGLNVTVLAYFWVVEEDMLTGADWALRPGEIVLGWGGSSSRPRTEPNGQTICWQDTTDYRQLGSPCAVLIDAGRSPRTRRRVVDSLTPLGGVTWTSSGSRFIEIRRGGTSKWSGIERVAHELNIATGDVLTLGDNLNDLEMITNASIGVAVKNAPQEVRMAADYVSSEDAAGGAMQLLRLITHARRLEAGLEPFRNDQG